MILALYQHIHFEQPTYMNLNQDLKFPPKPITKSGIIHIHAAGPIPEDLKFQGESKVLIQEYKLSGLLDDTLKTEVPCTAICPQSCKRSKTVCQKSRGLPRLY